MKKTVFLILLAAGLCSTTAFAQAYRIDPSPVMTTGGTNAPGGFRALYVVPGATITLCTTATCNILATTYTDATGLTACPNSGQVTLPGSFVCSASAGTQGQFGFWVHPGTYYYTVTAITGTFGPYPVTSGGSGGGSVTTTGSPANGRLAKFTGGTSISNGNLSGDCTTSDTLVIACTKTGGAAFAASATSDTTNAANITSGALSISRLPSLAGHTYLGNNGSGSATAAAITATQLTADLNVFTSSLQGLVPPSGGSTTDFLRADGTFASPPGPGGGTVTTTGSPASGNLAKFSGATSVVNGDLSGDCTTSGALIVTCNKTGGTSFAPSATTDATNASNIGSGTLAAARMNPTVSAHTVLGNNTGSSAAATFVRLACGDLSDAATSCATDATNASNLSTGTLAAARMGPTVSAHTFLGNITGSSTGATFVRPACADLSNASASCATDATNGSNIATGAIGIRVNPRTNTLASSASITINSDTTDTFTTTALAAGTTFNAPSGTPVNGQRLLIRIKDNGGSQTLAFNAIFRASSDLALPTATTAGKTQYNLFVFNSTDTKWDFLAFLDNL